MTVASLHKREIDTLQQQIKHLNGLIGSQLKHINNLKNQISLLQQEVQIVCTKENLDEKDQSELLKVIDDKIYKLKTLHQRNPHYLRQAKKLWTIRRILSPSLFRMDQKQLGAPSNRTVQRWKTGFKKEMGFLESTISDKYTDCGPVADMYLCEEKRS
ncbi:Hypothetical_protein [Hexamita inflata]|uniref:Hypothetical_protein n=1 Tax=Hexamita inflata TaxID=28002 RepID=A0AA86Q017_9EUKA|nr:Hypothetical protein HINF_LOCUS34700 [Hexamita inflata]CAI9947058.1 Hypothetical protein HINF_LOCUS34703 [Hexamita inflata]